MEEDSQAGDRRAAPGTGQTASGVPAASSASFWDTKQNGVSGAKLDRILKIPNSAKALQIQPLDPRPPFGL